MIKNIDESLLRKFVRFLNSDFKHLRTKEKIERTDVEMAARSFLDKVDPDAPYNDLVEWTCASLEIASEIV